MEPLDKKIDFNKRLKFFLYHPINFPENILRQMDATFDSITSFYEVAKDLYPLANKTTFSIPEFKNLVKNLQEISQVADIHPWDEDYDMFFQDLGNLLKNPFESLEKIYFLAEVKAQDDYGYNTRVYAESFKKMYFFKLNYDLLWQQIVKLDPFEAFVNTPRSSKPHHPFTASIQEYIRILPKLLKQCAEEIIPGVPYYEFPPSFMEFKNQAERCSQLFESTNFSGLKKKISKDLKRAIRSFQSILSNVYTGETRIKLEGVLNDKPGLYEFRRVVREIKKFRKKFESHIIG